MFIPFTSTYSRLFSVYCTVDYTLTEIFCN
jgi:hypothetical protein